jgi:glutathione peroxidase
MLMATTLNLYLPNLKSVVLGLFDTQAIKWNFTKFLIDSTGGPVKQYAPIISSRIIAKDIERQLVL